MNTPPDGRPPAVLNAEAGADAWRCVVHDQGAATADHGDWYAITGETVDTLRCLISLAGVLARQVAGYGTGRVLRDDAGADPAERLAIASSVAAQLRADLDRAERAANRLWSQIGHIAVEVDR
ncbi:MAG: hypothetical protein L0K86_00705 [Actinomycetia bacterium]|nr:hypothetical protein [Actinomycetes bacterium]